MNVRFIQASLALTMILCVNYVESWSLHLASMKCRTVKRGLIHLKGNYMIGVWKKQVLTNDSLSKPGIIITKHLDAISDYSLSETNDRMGKLLSAQTVTCRESVM